MIMTTIAPLYIERKNMATMDTNKRLIFFAGNRMIKMSIRSMM
jgi:hypothetical protein